MTALTAQSRLMSARTRRPRGPDNKAPARQTIRSNPQAKRHSADLPTGRSGLGKFFWGNSRRILALLSLYAGLRVLVFAAAFPIFNNVDEQAHFASIRSYAHGQWPGKELPLADPDLAKFYALFGTDEYLSSKPGVGEPIPTPNYQLPLKEAYARASPAYFYWLQQADFESQSPPLYYLLGAACYRLGAIFEKPEWELAYFARFLNSVAYIVMVWASYRIVRRVYPERVFLWLGVPALLAVFPQDVYFGLNRDVLSGPMTAVALLLMLKAVGEKEGNSGWLVLASAFVGLTFLDNISNCVLFPALALTLWFWLRRSQMPMLQRAWVAAGAVLASAVLPAIWMIRNRAVFGDFTGSRAKVEFLGWTVKPLGEIFDHPLFSFGGLYYFLRGLWESFWCGELIWQQGSLRWSFAVRVYLISSIVMILAVAVQSVRHWKNNNATRRFTLIQCFLLLFGSILFMAGISLLFDFHDCFYPSREHPFFISGRIISGALVPFVFIYVMGIEILFEPIRKWLPAVVLAGLMLFITVTEFQLRHVVFSSTNNFFAFRAWQQEH
jgi:hypothetical protein